MLCEKCGDICFLRSPDNGFPICPKCTTKTNCHKCNNVDKLNKSCCLVDCKALVAAKARASQYGYVNIVKKTNEIAKLKGWLTSNNVIRCPRGWEYGDLTLPNPTFTKNRSTNRCQGINTKKRVITKKNRNPSSKQLSKKVRKTTTTRSNKLNKSNRSKRTSPPRDLSRNYQNYS